MGNPFDERRKHVRIYRNYILSFYEKNSPTHRQYASQVNNISKGGLSFTSSLPIAQGSLAVVNLKTPFLADSLRLEGQVLECKEKVPQLLYLVRLQFQGVSENVMHVLSKIERYGKSK